MKRALTSTLSLLLALLMLLSLCGILSACKKDPYEEDEDHTPSVPEELKQETCSHAITKLTNARETSCARAGYTGDTVCTACGAIVESGESIPALPHTMDLGQVTKDPTCIEFGTSTRTCYECGWKEETSLQLVGHKDVYHDSKDGHTHTHSCATCTENKYESHVPKDAGVYYPGTCTEPAYILHTCVDCNATYKVWQDESTVAGHNFPKEGGVDVWQITEPTCSATGLKTRECLTCGYDETMVLKIASNAHNYVEFGRDSASCVSMGAIYYKCQNQGCYAETVRDIAINPHAHSVTTETTADGWTIGSCQNGCGYEVKTYTAPAGQTQASVAPSNIADDRTFELKTDAASVQFPTDVVAQMKQGNTAGDIDIQAGLADNKDQLLEDATNLTEEQKARLQDVDIFNFSVSGIENGFDSAVTVTIPYTLRYIEETDSYEDPNGIKVWYVAEDGNIQCFDNAVFVPNEGSTIEGYVTFSTTHFSYYAVAYEETQESKCRRGVHDWMPTTEDDVVAPTCTTFGYTLRECSTCHAEIYDNMVDKTNHAYGSLVYPVLGCTEGGYVTKSCTNEGCDHTFNVEYRAPLGHTPDSAATCTKDSVCTRCSNIVIPAHGHDWSDWVTVFEPTATKSGLRRKNCPKCGAIEDAKLAATGAVEPVTFESYEDLMETLMETALAFHNGKMTMLVTSDDDKNTVTMTIKVKEEGESYLMLIDIDENGTVTSYDYSEDKDNPTSTEHPYTNHIQFMYRNGVTVLTEKAVSSYTSSYFNRDDQYAYSDLESLFMLPYELTLDYMKQAFDLYAPTVEGYMAELSSVMRILDALAGDAVNDVLAEIGSAYTLGSLAELYDKTQTVYTYLALTLGFGTTLDLGDVVIPTAHDFMTVLGAFSTVTTDGEGNKTYTVDPAARLREVNAIFTWVKNHENNTYAEVLWTLLGDEVKTYYPDVTDWNAFVNKMKSTYTGSMLVKDAFNTAVDMLEKKGVCTLDELYAIMGLFLSEGGEPVDVEKMISENWNFTLDELAREMDFEDLDEFFTGMDEYFKNSKLGETVVDYYYESTPPTLPGLGPINTRVDVTLTERLDQILEVLGRIDASGSISFTLDADGRLLALNINTDVDYEAPADDPEMTGGDITLTLERDDNIVIELPANLQPVSNIKLQSVFDGEGNLLITAPEGFAYTFEVGGYGDIPLSELIEEDEEMSEKLGVTVYVLKPAYWDQSLTVGEYAYYNGKYYTWKEVRDVVSEQYRLITKEVTLAEIEEDPTCIVIPDNGDGYSYSYTGFANGTQVIVYDTVLEEYAFQMNGTWYLVKEYNRSWNEQLQQQILNITEYVALSAAVSGMQVSSVDNYYYEGDFRNEDGDTVTPQFLYLSLNVEAWGSGTVRAPAYVNDEGDIVLVDTIYVGEEYENYYQLGEEILASALPEHDSSVLEENYWKNCDFRDTDGEEITDGVGKVYFHRNIPTYYVKVNDDTYAGFIYETNTWFGDAYGNINVAINASLPSWIKTEFNEASTKKTVTLPDGNKLFVMNEQPRSGKGAKGQYDSIAWGWAKTNGIYVQAVARYFEGKLIEVLYRSDYGSFDDVGLSQRTLSFNDYIDLAQYLTKTGENTYRVSAAFFTRMQALCKDQGDSYWVRVIGKQTVSDKEYEFEATVGLYEKARTVVLGGRHDIAESYIYWHELFNSSSNGALFTVIPGSKTGDKNTITVRLNNGESIEATYSCDSGLYPVADGMIPYDKAMSEATGLPIYSAVTSHREEQYLYEGGKYYHYSSYSNYDGYTTTTLAGIKQTVANDWYVSRLTYRFDFTDEQDNTYPVYEATFRFGGTGSDYNSYQLSTSYVVIKEGKLYICSGAYEESPSVLRFEEMILPADYFRAAAERIEVLSESEFGETNYQNFLYINGQKKTLVRAGALRFADYKASGEVACMRYIVVSFFQSGTNRTYVSGVGDYIGNWLVKDSEMTNTNDLVGEPELETRDDFCNGSFTFAEIKRANYRHYVKLAGEYYNYQEEYFTNYYWYVRDQAAFENEMADLYDYYYGLLDEATGTWTYYAHFDQKWGAVNGEWCNYAELSGPITTLPTFTDGSLNSYDLSLTTKDGKSVKAFSGRVMGNLLTAKRSDGTVFYYKEGSASGFLKIADNKYVRAKMILNQANGSKRILCYDLNRATLDYSEIRYLNPLGEYLTVSADGASVKISKDILAKIPEQVRDSFRLTLERGDEYYGYVTLTYAQLEAWFELTEIKDCNSGNFNGFVDYDAIHGNVIGGGVIGGGNIAITPEKK